MIIQHTYMAVIGENLKPKIADKEYVSVNSMVAHLADQVNASVELFIRLEMKSEVKRSEYKLWFLANRQFKNVRIIEVK